jgi:glycosyltransferase involved in cell wall biosynthesis
MEITIFIVCYNEEIMIPKTVKHYRDRFPRAKIFICNNYSTDQSASIATSLGCQVINWETTLDNFEFKLTQLKDNVWKSASGWIIMCDMDEWLNINEEQLKQEDSSGTTILTVRGYDIIGNSQSPILDDIDLETLSMAVPNQYENKKLCFNTNFIKEINYLHGSHHSNPIGQIKMSQTIYNLKHMDWLGLPYKINKMKVRYERTFRMRQYGMAVHYTDNIEEITRQYNARQQRCSHLNF